MPITFSGTTLPQTQFEEIVLELYADWGTFRDKDININEKHKAGADVYEAKVSVGMKAYTGAAVTASSDSQVISKTPVYLNKFEYSDVINYNNLLNTRFERSMKAGAFETVSQEFDNYILQLVTPAIGEDMESKTWNGATSATKSAIAALTPGASQGSISAGAQTLVAAMPTTLFDSLPTVILYNNSQAKTTPGAGLGDYKKVLSISTVTSSNIAAQYALWYATLDPKVINKVGTKDAPVCFAPLSHLQMIKIANNAVGAAQQINFLVEGNKVYYNGIEIKFKPLVGFMIICNPNYLHLLMDLMSDMNALETGKQANGSDSYYYKNVQSFATWCTNQRYITLYGG